MTRKLYRIASLLGLVAIVLTAALAFASQALEDALSEKELETVVHYITNEVLATGRMDFTGEQIASATGIRIPKSESRRVQAAVLRELMSSPAGLACLSKLEEFSVLLERTRSAHRRGDEACCVKRFSFF